MSSDYHIKSSNIQEYLNRNNYEELTKNTEVLNVILDTINDGVLAVDNNSNIIHANKHFKEMWKIPDDLFLTKNSDELLTFVIDQLKNPEEYVARTKELYPTDKESLDIIEFIDGRIFQRVSKPLLIDNTIKGRVWCYKDITLFKQNERDLKDKIAFQHKFINTIPNPAFIKDQTGKYIDCNIAYEKFLGVKKSEILNKGVFEIFPEVLAEKYYKMDNELFESKGVQTYEHSMTHADGTIRDVSFNKATFMDAEGSVAGIVGLFADITEKKRIEKALSDSEERYRNLFDNSPYSIIVHDGKSIIFANAAAANLVGLSTPDELVGKNFMDFVHPDYHEVVKSRVKAIQSHETSIPVIEEKIIMEDGSVRDVEVAVNRFHYAGKITSQVVIKDITMRKREEELRKETENKLHEAIAYNKLITEFFANISHEFKTPLNIILGTFQLLILNLKEEQTQSQSMVTQKRIKVMQQNCYRLLRLVNNLIDITKIDSGYFELNQCNCNIINLIENVTLSVADYIQDKDLKLIFDTNVEEEIMSFDPDAIERIILNLLSNAVKFTNPGGIIHVSVESKNEKLTISVKDSGVGIPNDKKNIIFNRFRQVDRLLTRNREGSGIGLSLVKSLVEMHDGKILVNTSETVGTEFIIFFPIRLLKEKHCGDHEYPLDCVERINIEFSDIEI